MSAVSLAYPMAYCYNGILYLVGYRAGAQYIRRSADQGRTWLRYADGTTEKQVAASHAERVAFVKMDTQGCRLIVGVPQFPQVAMYISLDDGMTWVFEGMVG